jgi:hypothetical protein
LIQSSNLSRQIWFIRWIWVDENAKAVAVRACLHRSPWAVKTFGRPTTVENKNHWIGVRTGCTILGKGWRFKRILYLRRWVVVHEFEWSHCLHRMWRHVLGKSTGTPVRGPRHQNRILGFGGKNRARNRLN